MAPQKLTFHKRSSGILLHPTSLPGPFGIGDLGPSAYEFIDFLKSSNQRWWQMLPIAPTGYGNSPYNALSAFAGNPLLISLELLVKDGFLKENEIQHSSYLDSKRVDYSVAENFKTRCFEFAFDRFEKNAHPEHQKSFGDFCSRQKFWLEDFALYSALKKKNGLKSWTSWPRNEATRNKTTLINLKFELDREIQFHQFLQWIFERQWTELKVAAEKKGIGLIGDIPIFVAHDSADVWAHPELFYLDRSGNPSIVAGVPPDYFSKTGQRWGNPIYRWEAHKKEKYFWWMNRFKIAHQRFHVQRVDHFIGFTRIWSIPSKSKTAKSGKWLASPGKAFFTSLLKKIPSLQIIVEDLGILTKPVEKLRDSFHFPGIQVLQFMFGEKPSPSIKKEAVLYSGTHDNDTTQGWLSDKGSGYSARTPAQILKERENILNTLGVQTKNILEPLLCYALRSKSFLTIFPLQDILGLGTEARMNRPGSADGNWEWRLSKDQLSKKLISFMSKETKKGHRSS